MAHQRSDSYLKDSLELFRYYKKLAERAMVQCLFISARHPGNIKAIQKILPEGIGMAEASQEEPMARIAELEKKAGSKKQDRWEFKAGENGGVSIDGLGRFPVTLYYEQ
ncbi:MAG: hypothetical protein ACYDDI_12390 [Candidatus Acidiferrales bacterium]